MSSVSLVCPNCNTPFTVDQKEYDQIAAQVRNIELDKAVKARVDEISRHMAEKHAVEVKSAVDQAVLAANKESQLKLDEINAALAAANSKIEKGNSSYSQMRAKYESAERDKQMAISQVKAEAEARINQEKLSCTNQLTAEKEKHMKEIADLKNVLNDVKLQSQTEINQVKASQQVETDKLKGILELKEQEIERLRDFKISQSTKMVGESLEQHCEIEFNKVRMTAYPNASFAKDNNSSSGSKGDYIFREKDPSTGCELVSIMFEMKNETESDSKKQKNDSFFAKLDKDRTAKNCEYAVLVSTLEPESDYYNAGIQDVSYAYPKMYVVRPQNFLTIIQLLRQASLNALQYKNELKFVKEQNIDICNFEQTFENFKVDLSKAMGLSGKSYTKAIDDIDKAIKALETVKASLNTSNMHLNAAYNKVDGISVNKMAKGNATVQNLLDEAHTDSSTPTVVDQKTA